MLYCITFILPSGKGEPWEVVSSLFDELSGHHCKVVYSAVIFEEVNTNLTYHLITYALHFFTQGKPKQLETGFHRGFAYI